ncbi:MAG: hypothetical protein BWY75_02409 [bacterium ADurb.Bin425]|nr:MAG: hypothetical protein BWY75_02409 [bacterium ADurb.Bin425]
MIEFFALFDFGHGKVGDCYSWLGVCIINKDDIAWSNISMQHTLTLGINKHFAEAYQNLDGDIMAGNVVHSHALFEAEAVFVFADHIGAIVFNAKVGYLGYIGMG